MKLAQIFPVLKCVLLNPYVIGTAVVILLYCNFVSYIARYKKGPVKTKKKRASPKPQTQAKESDGAKPDEQPAEEAQE